MISGELMKRDGRRVAYATRGELAAGGVDVLASWAADEGMDALRFEDGLERLDALGRRGPIRQVVRRVVRDKIDLGAKLMAVEEVRQLPRLLVRVVDAVEHDVLEGEAL